MSSDSYSHANHNMHLDLRNFDSLSYFVRDIKKFPMLEALEEYQLASQWHKTKDTKAQTQLLGSHLRLVLKISKGYRGYGLPLHDLIAEGNIGLMQALAKFNPERGVRFSAYASWWVRAAIQDYVLKNWSLVKIGTTAAQKKLFFNFKKMRAKFSNHETNFSQETAQKIATELDVKSHEVTDMHARIQGHDSSLNAPISKTSDDGEWQDWLAHPQSTQEDMYFEKREMEHRQNMLTKSLHSLKTRDYHILKYRRLHEPPKTLDELSTHFKISKERVRQIEISAFQTLQNEVRKHQQTAA